MLVVSKADNEKVSVLVEDLVIVGGKLEET